MTSYAFEGVGQVVDIGQKKTGPQYRSLGTPNMTGTDEDSLPSTATDLDLFWRNDLIQETVFIFILKLNSL